MPEVEDLTQDFAIDPSNEAALKLLEETDPEAFWQLKYEKMSYKELASRMVELRDKAAKAKAEEVVTNKELDIIRLRIVPTRFAEEGFSSLNIPGIGRLGLTSDAHCTQRKELTEELYTFLRENEAGDLIKEGVNASSLKSYVKELLTEALESPAEVDLSNPDAEPEPTKFDEICKLVNFSPFMRASVTTTSKK